MRTLLLALLLAACGPAGDDDATPDDDDSVGDDDATPGDDDSGDDDSGDDGPSDDDDSATVQAGAARYATYCAPCHGEDGEGYAADHAPALANPEFLALATDAFLRSSIVHGRPGTVMSAWSQDYGGPLTPPQIDEIVAFLRSRAVGPPLDVHDEVVAGDPAVGRGLYFERCARCHDPYGLGEPGPSLDNPWFLAEASDGYLKRSIEYGRPGTPMDPWVTELSPAQVGALVVHLRGRARPVEDTKVPPFEPDLAAPLVHPEGPPADFEGALIDGRYLPLAALWAAYEAGQSMVIADARPGSDYLQRHVAGAVSTPFYRFEAAVEAFPQDRWVVAYCGCPHALSGELVDALLAAGFTKVAVLDEGWFAWLGAGYPTATGPEPGG